MFPGSITGRVQFECCLVLFDCSQDQIIESNKAVSVSDLDCPVRFRNRVAMVLKIHTGHSEATASSAPPFPIQPSNASPLPSSFPAKEYAPVGSNLPEHDEIPFPVLFMPHRDANVSEAEPQKQAMGNDAGETRGNIFSLHAGEIPKVVSRSPLGFSVSLEISESDVTDGIFRRIWNSQRLGQSDDTHGIS